MVESIGQLESSLLIFSGPHGAGKDTLEGRFRQEYPSVERIVRHITRPAAPGEVDGQDYHFVGESQFAAIVDQGSFVEHSRYPDCMAGTSKREIAARLENAKLASLTANFEEGLTLRKQLVATGIASICFFISPVSRQVMQDEPDVYIDALRARMENRGRPADRIANKLVKAKWYRELYLRNEPDITYINNCDGNMDGALLDITEAVRAPHKRS